MRIVLHGQQAFGKAVLEKLLERKEDVVAVFCAPDKEGGKPDVLKTYAEENNLPVHQPKSWKTPEAAELMASFNPDVCMMAYVTLMVPQNVLDIPSNGTFQYHPSLLPEHRGPSSINWPIIMGKKETGLTIFWPDEGLDEGPVLLQKKIEIKPDDTLGTLYFNHLFPMGVDAMLEALELVKNGKAPRIDQDHSKATYESWCKKSDARIDWSKSAEEIYNLIRGCNPQPGAWCEFKGAEIKIFDCELDTQGNGSAGEIISVSDDRLRISAPGGELRITRVRPAGQPKQTIAEWREIAEVSEGDKFS